jgi:arylsulfatase
VVRWPAGGLAPGAVRSQFHHVTDVVPTLLEAAGVVPRSSYSGVDQMEIHGTSMTYAFADPDAPTRRTRQYFEMIGARGMWSQGWKAVTNHEEGDDYDTEPWALYHLDGDFSETKDLAAEHPAKLAELKAQWWEEAERYGVLPLDDRWNARYTSKRPQTARTHFRLHGGTRLFSAAVGPNWYGRPFVVTADITRRRADDEGVLIAFGRRPAGFAFFIQDDRLVLDYNRVGFRHLVESAPGLPQGRFRAVLQVDQGRPDGRATATLRVDDTVLVTAPIEVLAGGLGNMSTQVGHNAPSGVSNRFDPPFAFTGDIHTVTVDFFEPNPSADPGTD